MEILIYTVVGFAIVVFLAVGILAHCVFDDEDPDLSWYDNYQVLKCPHHCQADVVVDYACTCETVETWCLDCGEKLSERIDC